MRWSGGEIIPSVFFFLNSVNTEKEISFVVSACDVRYCETEKILQIDH